MSTYELELEAAKALHREAAFALSRARWELHALWQRVANAAVRHGMDNGWDVGAIADFLAEALEVSASEAEQMVDERAQHQLTFTLQVDMTGRRPRAIDDDALSDALADLLDAKYLRITSATIEDAS